MTNRIIILLIAFCLALSPLRLAASGAREVTAAPVSAQAAVDPDIDPDLDGDFDAVAVDAQFSASLPVKSAILLEQNTGKVLYEMNPDEQIPPASVTKIMTLLLVMEALESGKISMDDMVVTSEYANSMGGSQIWLKVGEEMSVGDLLKAVAIASANDASAALGEHIAGSGEAFVRMMNDRAAELGMTGTHFMNPTGLDDTGHLTTARDIAIMSRELMKHPQIVEFTTIWMDSLRGGATELVNTNKLVRFYNGATGLKTGTTSGAGSCLSATATRDGLSLVAVVMGAPTSNDRFASARGLLDFGFANYISAAPPSIASELVPVRVLRGTEDSVMPVYGDPGTFVVEKGQEDSIEQKVTLVEDLEAPVVEGQVIGRVEVLVAGEAAGQYELMAASPVERMTFFKAFGKLTRAMLRMNRGSAPTAPAEQPKISDTSEAEPPAEPCTCGQDKCYCKQIGDICGCQSTEKK